MQIRTVALLVTRATAFATHHRFGTELGDVTGKAAERAEQTTAEQQRRERTRNQRQGSQEQQLQLPLVRVTLTTDRMFVRPVPLGTTADTLDRASWHLLMRSKEQRLQQRRRSCTTRKPPLPWDTRNQTQRRLRQERRQEEPQHCRRHRLSNPQADSNSRIRRRGAEK